MRLRGTARVFGVPLALVGWLLVQLLFDNFLVGSCAKCAPKSVGACDSRCTSSSAVPDDHSVRSVASFDGIDGESLLLSTRNLAASSGSACTSAHPEPSHVLRSLGLTDETVRGSVRFGLGRSNTEAHVNYAIEAISDAVDRLRKMSSLPVLRPDA